jgi:uncharacterized protein
VVSSVVNNVGVNLNTASASLLKYVSGINSALAKKIVKYRDEKGKIGSREELISVPGMGPKSFEQSAGFLKIPESSEDLDNTWVHPENYAVAREIKKELQKGATVTATGISAETITKIKEQYKVGDTTISDIIEEFKKPNRDPRDGYPKPVMQKGVIAFEDLTEGMKVTGKIKNVVDFGAFVDLGIKETALVHISELSDGYVKDPMSIVKVGDVLEFRIIGLDRDRRRISLSRKSETGTKAPGAKGQGAKAPVVEAAAPGRSDDGKKHAFVKKAESPVAAGPKPAREPRSNSRSDDDGTMYNPFADAFRKMGKK